MDINSLVYCYGPHIFVCNFGPPVAVCDVGHLGMVYNYQLLK